MWNFARLASTSAFVSDRLTAEASDALSEGGGVRAERLLVLGRDRQHETVYIGHHLSPLFASLSAPQALRGIRARSRGSRNLGGALTSVAIVFSRLKSLPTAGRPTGRSDSIAQAGGKGNPGQGRPAQAESPA